MLWLQGFPSTVPLIKNIKCLVLQVLKYVKWLITESSELEGTIKDHLVQLPCNKQGHTQLDQVAQGLIQPYPESLQG